MGDYLRKRLGLSEGEFVFPADVVRFIGLEKLM